METLLNYYEVGGIIMGEEMAQFLSLLASKTRRKVQFMCLGSLQFNDIKRKKYIQYAECACNKYN